MAWASGTVGVTCVIAWVPSLGPGLFPAGVTEGVHYNSFVELEADRQDVGLQVNWQADSAGKREVSLGVDGGLEVVPWHCLRMSCQVPGSSVEN